MVSSVATAPVKIEISTMLQNIQRAATSRPGSVVGASDRDGAYPQGDAVGPWDVAATVFHALGIDREHYTDAAGRLFPLATGRPITAAYG